MADSVPSVSAAGSGPQRTTGRALVKKPAKKKPVAKPAALGLPTAGARLAQYLADPGLRSKLPDSSLTPDLLQTRRTNQYNASPAAPGSSYSNHDLDALINVLSRQKYGQAEQGLQQQQQNIPAWFQAYRDQVAAAQKTQNDAAAAQVASLQQAAQAAAGQTGALAGAPMDQAGADRAQAAAAIRSAGIGNQQALATNLGGIQNAYMGNLGLNSFGMQRGALDKLAAQQTQLALDKGDFKTTQRQSILSDEADAALKNALTEAQTGAQNANTAATKASTQKTKVTTTKTKAELDYFKQHGYYPKTGPTTPKAPDVITSGAFAGYTKAQVAKMDPAAKQQKLDAYNKKSGKSTTKSAFLPQTSQNSFKDSFDAAVAAAKKRQGLGEDRHAAAQLLLNGRSSTTVDHNGTKVKVPSISKIPKDVLSAALDYVYDGHLSRHNVEVLHKRGIKVKNLGVPTKGSAKAPSLRDVLTQVASKLPGA
jgi:hypothetical protein